MAPKSDKGKAKKKGGTYSYEEPKKEFSFEEITNMVNLDEKEHGKGRFAKVYKGALNFKEVAVKKYPSEHKNQAENEIQALSDLKGYRNIVPLIGYCRHKEYYLVMKFIPNNLKDLIEGVALNWEETVHILSQLAWSIKAIIEQNYVVGDIKPDNILIDDDHSVYLCDFGSAVKDGRHGPTINYQYASKEVIRGTGDQSKSDIYSFGVILLQMVMKCNDFGDVDLNATIDELMKSMGGKKGKNKKKEKNTSNKPNYHIVIQARIPSGHVVDSTLLQSGCGEEEAFTISNLGIACTSDHVNQRPQIDAIISTLEEMKNNGMLKHLSKS